MASVPACLLSTVPVIQPPHLEGDPSLATEILPGPPSLESIRQLSKKNEPRKFPLPSYLPLSDPGTTYTSLAGGMAALALDETGPRRKRARMDKGISNRAQRASARHLTGGNALSDQALMLEADATSSQPGLDDGAAFNDDDRSTSHSRSTSAPLNGDTQAQSASANGIRVTNGKGKGKEKENPEKVAQVRVKEEPINMQLCDLPAAPTNEDHCSSCSSVGALVYCDGCPRAFHLWCLDPPMDPSDFPEGEESWFCPACKPDKGPPPKPSHSLLSPLIQQLHNAIPTEFRLPEEIRTFFRDVGTGPGGVYVDNSSVKANRIGRHGFGEERDPYRLKDNKGAPVICFRCGKSALQEEAAVEGSVFRTRRASTVPSQSQHWKSMVSCDFCSLHWHVDCLDPPLTSLPPINRKWKCPNHASGSAPKLRTPRTTAPPIDITETRQRNNGIIEVISSEVPSRFEDKMSVDEVLINGRRYRVPERIVVLDFWNKMRQQKTGKTRQTFSTASSPLTSLSSLDDIDDVPPPPLTLNKRFVGDDDILGVAQLLCQLQSQGSSPQIQNTNMDKGTQRALRESVRSGWHVTEPKNTKSLDLAQLENRTKEQSKPYRFLASSVSSNKSWSKAGVNGTHTSRHGQISGSHHHSKHKQTTAVTTSTRSLRNSKTDQNAPLVNSVRDAGSETTNGSNETTGIKPSTSSLKIRIPSRLLQKQSSTSSASGVDNAKQISSVSSFEGRPRRSLRSQASMNGTGSERSMSVDHGQDGL